MLRAALVILAKDLRLRARDRSVYLFAFVVPLGLTLVLSLVFPSESEFHLEGAVVDLDGGQVAAGFREQVLGALDAQGMLTLTGATDEAAARELVEDGTVSVAWILPAGFSDGIMAGQGGVLTVLVNPDRALSAEVARAVAEGFAVEVDRVTLAVATAQTAAGEPLPAETVDRLTAELVEAGRLVGVEDLVTAERRLDTITYLAAGMTVFFLFFTVTFGVTGYLEERQQGTLPRLLAAPIGPAAVHVGKALGSFLLGLVSMAFMWLLTTLLMGASWGDPGGVALLIVAAAVSALGLMLLVGSFARTPEQASNLQSIVALVLGLAGGVFFPISAGWAAQAQLISPHAWFLRGLADVTGEGTWTAAIPSAAALLAAGVVFAMLGALRLRRLGR